MKKVLCCPGGKKQRSYPWQINRRKSQLWNILYIILSINTSILHSFLKFECIFYDLNLSDLNSKISGIYNIGHIFILSSRFLCMLFIETSISGWFVTFIENCRSFFCICSYLATSKLKLIQFLMLIWCLWSNMICLNDIRQIYSYLFLYTTRYRSACFCELK
jgi:hypothetical protein